MKHVFLLSILKWTVFTGTCWSEMIIQRLFLLSDFRIRLCKVTSSTCTVINLTKSHSAGHFVTYFHSLHAVLYSEAVKRHLWWSYPFYFYQASNISKFTRYEQGTGYTCCIVFFERCCTSREYSAVMV